MDLQKQDSDQGGDSGLHITVDEYMAWVATFDNLPPEMKYVILTKAGGRIVEGGSNNLRQAHTLLLQSIRQECDPDSLTAQLKDANLRVFQRNKGVYILCGLAALLCLCVAVYKFSKVISHVVL